ncbi:hypothetical protein [Paraburkholderia sp. MM5477-R1]|uniref:hypothetical protein n=1 Tax=Paraburkholderia sp. MM5477-R1 TaxID=2991062 RepID=UPI003D2450B9
MREALDARRIRPVRIALQNQRDDLLAFAGVLDEKLAAIAQRANVSDELVRAACVLRRKPRTHPRAPPNQQWKVPCPARRTPRYGR